MDNTDSGWVDTGGEELPQAVCRPCNVRGGGDGRGGRDRLEVREGPTVPELGGLVAEQNEEVLVEHGDAHGRDLQMSRSVNRWPAS